MQYCSIHYWWHSIDLGLKNIDLSVLLRDSIILFNCAGVVGMFSVGSVTVLATTPNVDDNEDEEEDTAPALFLVILRKRRTFCLLDPEFEKQCGVILIRNFVQKVVVVQSPATVS